MTALRKMYVELHAGEGFQLDGGKVIVTLEQKSGRRARMKIEAVDAVKVDLPKKNGGAVSRLVPGQSRVGNTQERVGCNRSDTQ